jgi:lipooligosaccharide transport system ATP-binding protein
MSIIEIKKLTKKFKELVAVDNIDMEIEAGECFGMLGPNGAGKTTLIRMMTAISPPTSGNISVLGLNLRTNDRYIKSHMGVVPQHDNLDADLTTLENMTVFARYFDIPSRQAKEKALELLEFFELKDKLKNKMDELSGGMKRRLLIARSLLNQPDIIVLDEPTTGLDPHARLLVWEKLTELKSRNITQILCTQNMDEASYLCDRVAIMDHGRILCLDAPDRLISSHVSEIVWEIGLHYEDRNRIITGLKERDMDYRDMGGMINIFDTEDEQYLAGLMNQPHRLRRRPANLEDVFLKLTGRTLEG